MKIPVPSSGSEVGRLSSELDDLILELGFFEL
jgi:hypothetical protein